MSASKNIGVLICFVLGLASLAGAGATTLSDRVVRFCQDRLGQQVGDGQCSSLADAALKAAGAKSASAFKQFPARGDLVWGELVYVLVAKAGSHEEKKIAKMGMQTGDVIQLRDARFEGMNYFLVYPLHTAVIVGLKENGKTLVVLEQNVGKKGVVSTTYSLNDLKTGSVRVYRPVPK
jgi:hypothetical protein